MPAFMCVYQWWVVFATLKLDGPIKLPYAAYHFKGNSVTLI